MNEIRLWTCLKKYAPLFLLILVCAAASASLAAVGPLLLGNATTVIFDGIMSKLNGTGRMDFDVIARILGTALVLYLTSGLFAAAGSRLTVEAEGRLAHRFRRMMAEKLHVLPAQYYEAHAAGETMAEDRAGLVAAVDGSADDPWDRGDDDLHQPSACGVRGAYRPPVLGGVVADGAEVEKTCQKVSAASDTGGRED